MKDLTQAESHFRFGKNWADFAKSVTQEQIDQARTNLASMLGRDDLRGLTFLDIGSGSGLHSLAALQLGASRVLATDIDRDSVETTQSTLRRYSPNGNWSAELRSVFDLQPSDIGKFDIVYSWGVLHHTGDMYRAIRTAAQLVAPDGIFGLALYAKTSMCGFWRVEKRIYSQSSPIIQRLFRSLYVAVFWLVQTALGLRRGQLFSWKQYVAQYKQRRGMLVWIDFHDWLGGYPYESVSPPELRKFMSSIGFSELKSFLVPGGRTGLLGSGCDEYVFGRSSAS